MELGCSLERAEVCPVGCIAIYWFNMHTLQCFFPFPTFCLLISDLIYMVIYRYFEYYHLKGIRGEEEWADLLFIRRNLQSSASLKIWPSNCIHVSSVRGHREGQGKGTSWPLLSTYCVLSWVWPFHMLSSLPSESLNNWRVSACIAHLCAKLSTWHTVGI